MKRSRTTIPSLAAGLCLAVLSSGAFAQSTAVRPGTPIIQGENPYIRLLDKADGKTLTMVSFWRVHWSPMGAGHVCYVTIGEPGEPGETRVALYDNEKLYTYLTNEILARTSPAYKDRPFKAVPGATFGASGDSVTQRSEACRAAGYDIKLSWNGLQAPELMDIPLGSRPNSPFGLMFLRLTATTADVTINGQRAPGTTFGGSALAFGETWLKEKE